MISNKIVVVGGGSSGWMTAATLIKAFPEKEIVVIESPDHAIVGVGESTLIDIKWWTHFLEIEDKDFMRFCDASYKMSIKFTDFYDKNDGGYHYPFVGELYLKDSLHGLQDWLFKKSLYPETSVQDFARTYVSHMPLIENNKMSYDELGEFDGFNFKRDVAYNFDATKFGIYLRDYYCIPRGVKIIKSTVEDAVISNEKIERLVLKNGESITSDLFIDCTGFYSLLIEKFLKTKFISYEDVLPNNRAWASRIQYKDKEIEIESFANSTAIENGWCWNLPLWSRLGSGYVYSDRYVSPENALNEFKKYLMSDKIKIPRTKNEIECLEFKDVKFRVGIHEKIWVGNVVAMGLSAGFIEPLESNGLWTVQAFLFQLLRVLEKGKFNQWDIDCFNSYCRRSFNNFAEFIGLHYALSVRDDTKYWKDISSKSFHPKMIDLEPEISNGYTLLQYNRTETNTLPVSDGITWISIGMRYFVLDRYDQDFIQFKYQNNHNLLYDKYFVKSNENKVRWEKSAKNKLSHYEFLKKNIYSN